MKNEPTSGEISSDIALDAETLIRSNQASDGAVGSALHGAASPAAIDLYGAGICRLAAHRLADIVAALEGGDAIAISIESAVRAQASIWPKRRA